MKSTCFVLTCLIVLTSLAACGGSRGVVTEIVTSGDQSTANVWGIQIEVASPMGKSAGSSTVGTIAYDSEETNAYTDLTMGDDVTVRLEKVPGNPIVFTFNDEKYGTLEKGDFVTIDEDRVVMVNGLVRDPDESAP